MARRRLQQRGSLEQEGGWWRLRWMLDKADAEGKVRRGWSPRVTIGPATSGSGMEQLTEKQARRIAWEQFLSKLDQNQRVPLSMMTVEQFVERRFVPGHVRHRKKSGREHYASMLKHVLPGIGRMRLCDVRKEHAQALCNAVLDSGLSWQTAKHVKNCVSAIFTFAEGEGCFAGANPARRVELGEERRVRPRRALSFRQAVELLAALPRRLADFCRVLLLTGMNISEALGLRWKWVNLGTEWEYVEGEALPPACLAVRCQWYRGEEGSVKVKDRRRDIPLADDLLEILRGLRQQSSDPESPVFTNCCGRRLDAHNQLRRVLKPAGAALGMPWISWHVFRHTHATWMKSEGLPDADRMRLMGHASMAMTDRYTSADGERQREVLNAAAAKLRAGTPKVIEMRKAR